MKSPVINVFTVLIPELRAVTKREAKHGARGINGARTRKGGARSPRQYRCVAGQRGELCGSAVSYRLSRHGCQKTAASYAQLVIGVTTIGPSAPLQLQHAVIAVRRATGPRPSPGRRSAPSPRSTPPSIHEGIGAGRGSALAVALDPQGQRVRGVSRGDNPESGSPWQFRRPHRGCLRARG